MSGRVIVVTALIVNTGVALLTAPPAPAQQTFRLVETLSPGLQFGVTCRVEVSGSLALPAEKNALTPKRLSVSGNSVIEYVERILTVNSQQQAKTTARWYRKLEFQRTVGEQKQSSALRPEVRRLVILRQNQVEAPFSPDGPMTWNEMDLIRTDVFTPALTGLLPTQAVRVQDRWTAANFSVQELTDLDKIEEGAVTCQLDQLVSQNGRRLARIAIAGTVRGVGEDGPTRHSLDGHLFFDVESNHISQLSIRGVQQLLDKDGRVGGKIEGAFVLTRRPESCRELSDESLRPLKLEPNEDNTQLLWDNPELGVRFLHPRRWKVAGTRGRQVGLDENGGSGLLLTVEPLKDTPTAAQFLQESKTWLEQQKATVLRVDQPRALQSSFGTVEQFSMETEIENQKVLMVYFVVRQANGGATIAARVAAQQQQLILQDLDKFGRGLQLRRAEGQDRSPK